MTGAVEVPPSQGPDNKNAFVVTTPPPWMDQAYFEKALQSYEKDKDLKITAYFVAPAVKPGDNFASVVFRIKASYTSRGTEKKDASFILKVEPFLEDFRKDTMGDTNLFPTESSMYLKTLPEMQRLLKNAGDDEIIAPDMVFSSENPKVVVFEDVSPEFTMSPEPMGLEPMKKVMKKLAKYHALSFYMHHDSNGVANYVDGFFSEKMQEAIPMMQVSFNVLGDTVKSWGKEMEPISDKLIKLRPHFAEKLTRHFRVNPPGVGYNVLNHGDFHIKNLLFRYGQDGSVDAIRFIDFQLCVFASPALDLGFALYCIADRETRDNHREELTKIYHTEFVAVLSKLGFLKPVPSLLDLNIEILRNGWFEVFLATCFMGMFFVDFKKMQDLGGFAPENMEKIGALFFEHEEYQAILKKALLEFMYKGYLDV